MVRRGGRSYRKQSQKGPRGGKTRREKLRDQINREREKLRKNNLTKVETSGSNHKKYAKKKGINKNKWSTMPIFAIVRSKKMTSKWELRVFSVNKYREKVSNRKGGGYTETKRTRYYLNREEPMKALLLKRFDTKKEAMNKINVDSTDKVDEGQYIVRAREDPSTGRTFTVDDDEWRRFTRNARRVS